jgi:cytidine deaminase
MKRKALLAAARAAAEHAYTPYARFRVGAAVVMETPEGEQMATGANVENASYGLTICAERVALASLFQLIPPGEKPRITQVAIACIDAPEDALDEARVPCGACRQWLAELAPEAAYYVDGIARDLTLPDLLPLAFRLERE